MADLEDGEIVDSSDEEMHNEVLKPTENGLKAEKKENASPDYSSFTSRQETSSRISAIRSGGSSGYRSNTPDVGSDSSSGSESEEDTPLWRQKKAKYFRSQKEQSMVVCPSPTLPEYKPQSPQTSQQEPPTKKRKNNVWGSVLVEQDLTQSMARGGQVLEKTEFNYVERNVESYDFSRKHLDTRPNLEDRDSPEKVESNDPFDKVIDSYTSKVSRSLVDYEDGFEDLNPDQPRRRGVKRKADVKERLGQRMKDRLGTKKVDTPQLGELDVSVEMDDSELSQKIAQYLHEPKTEIIERIVSCLGKEEAIDLVNKTRDIEEAGGMMTKDGDRRRTPGGVYIQLMKFSPKFSSEMNKIIFKEDVEEKLRYRKEQKQLRKKWQHKREGKKRRNYDLKQQRSGTNQQQASNSKSQKSSNFKSQQNQTSKERRSWSTESEASSSENEMDVNRKESENRISSGDIDFQAELENTKKLILQSKSKENTDCAMEEGQTEGLKEAKSVESLPEEEKENMEDSSMNDLLEEESNVIDIPLGDE